jgi:hypothetical protein
MWLNRYMPAEVAAVIDAMPEPSRTRVLQLRNLVLAEADALGIAPVEETALLCARARRHDHPPWR